MHLRDIPPKSKIRLHDRLRQAFVVTLGSLKGDYFDSTIDGLHGVEGRIHLLKTTPIKLMRDGYYEINE